MFFGLIFVILYSMRILIDVRVLSRGGFSGIEYYTRSIINNLLRFKREHCYILFYNGLKKAALPHEWIADPLITLHSPRIPNKIFDCAQYIFHRPRIERHSNPDIVISPHINNLTVHVPRILAVHDLSFIHHPYFFSLRHRVWHRMQNIKRQLLSADRVIADSDFTKSDIIRTFNIPEEKVMRIYPGITLPQNGQTPERSSAFFNTHSIRKPYVLYIGTIEPRKNVYSIIKAFEIVKRNKQWRDLQLVLAGSMGWLYGDVLQAHRKSSFYDSIRIVGSISEKQKSFLYEHAEVFVYPSFFEGFGFPPLEAQSYGVPVIASNRASLPEVLHSSALLIDPWRIGECAEALEAVLNNEMFKMKLRKAGLENVKRFSWEKTTKEIMKIVEYRI